MGKSLDDIYQTLQKLIGLHRQLLETVRAEREALIQANLKEVQDCTLAKQSLIEAIKRVEVERLKSLGDLAILWKKPIRELTLPNLIMVIQGEDLRRSEQFRSALNALTLLIQRINEQNRHNHAVVQSSLKHVGEMKKNVLGESTPKSETYTPLGQRTPGVHGARLISKEA